MPETDPLSDILTLVAAPLAGTIRSVEQFRKGVDEFLSGVENFNRTMVNLNQTAERMNGLLNEVEEPLRAAIPQVTRTIQAADEVMTVMSGPSKAIAPALVRLADALDNPAVAQMPMQMRQMNDLLVELTSRMAPLGQLAESAGGLLGGIRLPGFPAPRPTTPTETAPVDEASSPATTEPPATPAAATKGPAKKPPVKKAAAKKRAAAKKAPAKRASTKKAPPADV